MTALQTGLLIAYAVVAVAACWRHVMVSRENRRMVFLRPGDAGLSQTAADVPLVSILVPAKDEEATIHDCVAALLEQTYPSFELLVIDDRSEDRTAEIVRAFADSRVRLVQVADLPAGWTGKTHALHVGQQQARGEWLLFVDADTTLRPTCVDVVMADATGHGVVLESLMPGLALGSFWERVVQPFASPCLMMFYPLSQVNDPARADMGFANGMFILFRRDGYDAIGGHGSVRERFVEDIHLGRRVRRAGLPLRVVMAPELAKVRMYASLEQIVRGWTRILYSGIDANPWKMVLLLTLLTVFSLASYAALAASAVALATGHGGPFWWTLLGLATVHHVAQATLWARLYALPHADLRYLALRLLAVLVMVWIAVRTLATCFTGRIRWRGTDYDSRMAQR